MEVLTRPRDTYWLYSQLFNISVALIEKSNPGIPSNQLPVGRFIRIPGFKLQSYTVQPNDTLWKLSLRYQMPLDALLLVNQEINPEKIFVGQQLRIPFRITGLTLSDVNNYTYDKMVQDIERLSTLYPFINVNTIGSSILDKDIIEIQVGSGNEHVHVNGSFHANEWITTPIIMRFLNEYLLALTNNNTIRGLDPFPLFQQKSLSLVPMVNPDGVNLVINGPVAAEHYQNEVLAMNNYSHNFSNWKANIRGVDLNNQYPANWTQEADSDNKPNSPSPRDFPGYAPLTEPEAIAIVQLTRDRNFSRVHALHTQGEVIYWGYQGLEPTFAREIVNEYARVSGYIPIQYIESYAGYKDWFIQEYRRPGFTIELGTGVNPLPINQFEEIYEETLGIMLVNLYF